MECFRTRGMEVVYCDRMTPARAFTEVPPLEVYEWVTKVSRQAEAIDKDSHNDHRFVAVKPAPTLVP